MPYLAKRPPLDPCPLEEVLTMISGKWKVRILYLLSLHTASFAQIRKGLLGIRQQVLSTQLKELCASGLVRHIRTTRGKTGFSTYALTPLALDLMQVLSPLAQWGQFRLADRGLEWKPPPTPQPKIQ